MHPSPARRLPQAAEALMSSRPPMSPLSGGEPSPFDLLGDDGDEGPSSPSDDLDGSQQDPSGQRWDSEIAEQARHEAEIENRIAELRKEGFWTPRRLSKFPEPSRPKVQWDYLCEEMQWLSGDFAQERRWKRGVARKVVRMVVRHHEELKQKEERARREEQAKLRRIATAIAKEVRQFWTNVEKVVQFKQQSRLEAKRKKALDLQLDFIVGQTEKYSDLLSQSLNEAPPTSKTSSSGLGSSQGGSLRTSPTPSLCQKDGEFLPDKSEEEEEDDEETIEMEERQDGNDAESHRLEIELLKRESELPLDELLLGLPQEILQDNGEDADTDLHDDDDDSSSSSEEELVEEDDEFTANEDEAEDEEETIEAEEALDSHRDHTQELSELAREGEMSIEDLLRKYSLVRTDHEETAERSESSRMTDTEEYGPSECGSSDTESEGVEFLVKPEDEETGTDQSQLEAPEPKKEITDIAATAESLQPKGYTLATTQVKTSVPFLLRGDLREYQHIGLEWLVTMYEKKLNGILADEMGLGKTIQTISLLAHLACERGNWGPHLIIVPTSVILNWEMELKRWCPSFKILTYYGSQKERKLKRQGWTKANAFHVCITSYKLVLQDHQAFRRKNWRYLILDEAQNIKNFKSQRWQSLLNFNSQRRLLLTGTPLQNSLMELWSLMHFLMPHVFQSHREFKEWFSNPLTGMIEGSQEYNEGLVRRLHKVLRPFLLRRIKLDVEKQMPKKYEHVIYCRLSKRQRFLYDDFMSQASTRESLTSGHFMSVINILMQLRKVCNHPNLFDPRPIHSPFITSAICYSVPSLVLGALQRHPLQYVDMAFFNLVNLEGRTSRYESDIFLPRYKPSRLLIQEIADSPEPPPRPRTLKMKVNRMLQPLKTDPRPAVTVNGSRPTQKPSDPARSSPPPAPEPPTPPPVPSSPPATAEPSLPEPPAPTPPPSAPSPQAPVPVLPSPVLPSPVPAPVTAVSSGPAKALPVPTPVPTPQPVYSAQQQRFILTPDMQARLPSGEVISLGQLASLSGRPIQSPPVTKPLTLQLQGAKLTLAGSQVRPAGVGPPRPVQGNVLHLVSSGGQHHLLSQPAQLALIQALAQQSAPPPSASQMLPSGAPAQMGVQAVSVQGIQHPLVNNSNLPAPSGPAMPSPGQAMAAQGVVKIVVRQAPRDVQPLAQRPPLPPQVRPVLRVLPGPHTEQPSPRETSGERVVPVVASSGIPLASSPLLMVSSPAARLPSPSASCEDSLTPPLSGMALRLVAAGTSPAVQLTNHQASPPRHTGSPALPNCFTCPTPLPSSNCTPTPGTNPDHALSTLPPKAAPNSDAALPDHHPVHNGNGVQNQTPDPSLSAAPNTSCPTTPPVTNLSKLSPPTYNLSLVPTLIANNSSASSARFLASPVSLLALSALSSGNGGPSSVLYTPPNSAAFPGLAAPLPATSLATSIPILTTPVSGQLAPFGSPLAVPSANQNSLPIVPHAAFTDAHSVSTPLSMIPNQASSSLLAAQSAASMLEASSSQPLLLAQDSSAMPLLDSSASEPLSPLVLNTSLKIPTMASTPLPILPGAAVPLLAQSSSNAVPFLAGQSSSVSLLAASSSNSVPLLAASSSSAVPLLAGSSSSAVPLLARSSSSAVPLLAGSSSSAVPLLASSSNAVPLLAGSSSSAVPLLAGSSSSAVPLLAGSSSSAVPLLAGSSSSAVPLLAGSSSSAVPLVASSSSAVPLLGSSSSALMAASSGKVPASFLSVSPQSNSLPLLSSSSTPLMSSPSVATTACASSQPISGSSMNPMTPVASLLLTTSPPASCTASSSSPSLVVTPSHWLSKPLDSVGAVQGVATALMPSGLLDAQAPMASMPAELPAPLCPSAALEASVVSALVGSMPMSTSSPSISASVVSPSMPASAPASCPSIPASTPPVPLPPLPTPVPTLQASFPGQAPATSSLAPSMDSNASMSLLSSADPPGRAPVGLLPSHISAPPVGPHHTADPEAKAGTLPSSPGMAAVVSVPSQLPVLPSSDPSAATHLTADPEAKAGKLPSPPASGSNLPTSCPPDPTPVYHADSNPFPESSLSLSVAGPPLVSTVPGTTPEPDIKLEQEEPRFSSAVNTLVRPRRVLPPPPRSPFYLEPLEERRRKQKMERLDRIFHLNERRCGLSPVYGTEILSVCTLQQSLFGPEASTYLTDTLRRCVFSPEQRLEQLRPIIERFIIAMPPVEAPQISLHTSHPPPSMLLQETTFREALSRELTPHTRCLHRIVSNMRTQFPDLRLIQYDCGKLQTMDRLLRDLKYGGHRVLIFTQMTRMLDVLEQFLNYHGHIYLRLDGSTRVEQRQVLMERFNMDKRIFCFILSTRSGGVGVNLTGADTVIFYDSDWNPTMDAQAQDRCHRIGQTRDVHIYRLVSERTVEENILKKAQQKRMLGDMAIEGGNFTTAYFKQQTIRELFDMEDLPRKEVETREDSPEQSTEEVPSSKQTHILEQALGRAEDEEDTRAASLVRAEQVADMDEFNENAPLEPEEEEQSRVEQEISALVEQLTPIERYAMYFLEASLEEVTKEELKQAEEQVEAARKDLILAKDEGCPNYEEKWEEETRRNRRVRTPVPARPPGERLRVSERLKGNRAAESTDAPECSANTPPDTTATPEVTQEVPAEVLEEPPVTDVGNSSHEKADLLPDPDVGNPSHEKADLLPVTDVENSSHEKADLLPDPDVENSSHEKADDLPVTDVENSSHEKADLLPVSDVSNSSHEKADNLPVVSEVEVPALPAEPPVIQAEESSVDEGSKKESSVEVQEPEPPVTVIAKEEEVPELNTGATVDGHDSSEQPPPGSPVPPPAPPPPQVELTPPRTPRRKVTADGEILLAGANDTSPTAKVLRRLPGRLVTVVQERSPTARRQSRAKVQQTVTDDNSTPITDGTDHRSPPCDLLSEDSSETGSPPPKRKRGRPPRTLIETSPSTASALPPNLPPASPAVSVPSQVSDPMPASPIPSSKLNLENENASSEKRKRGRPPKRRDESSTSPAVSSPAGMLSPAAVSSPAGMSSAVVSLPAGMSPAAVSSPVDESPAAVSSPAGKSPVAVSSPAGKSPVAVSSPALVSPVAVSSPAGKSPVAVSSPAGKSPVAVSSPAGKSLVAVSSPAGKSPVAVSSPAGKSPVAVSSPASKSPFAVSSPASKSPVAVSSPAAVSSSAGMLSPPAVSSVRLRSPVCTSAASPASTSVNDEESDTTAAKTVASQVKAAEIEAIIPSDSSNIPSLGGEATTSSGEEPSKPLKRKPGRPRRKQDSPQMNLRKSSKLHTDKMDSSPDRTPSPKPLRGRQRKPTLLKVEPKAPTSSQTETEVSSSSSEEEEEVKRTPLTRSARTRLEAESASPGACKNYEASPKPQHTHSSCATPASEKPPAKKRKPPSASSPSPPSSPSGSSGSKQKVPRKKGARPPVERVLRSALTANPASNTRSSRNQVIYSPSSHRGRKAKT